MSFKSQNFTLLLVITMPFYFITHLKYTIGTKMKGERESLLTCVLNADLQRKICIVDCINTTTKPKK